MKIEEERKKKEWVLNTKSRVRSGHALFNYEKVFEKNRMLPLKLLFDHREILYYQ